MRAIDADRLKEHIDKLPALPDGNFAGNHSALKALINMQPSVETESCGDCISRQAVLETQAKYAEHIGSTKFWQMRDEIRSLPSVEPERKTGKWIRGKDGYIRCDKCGSRGSAIKAHYCHHCGAKMEVDG